MIYKTPQEAIDACDAACKIAWEEFIKTHNLDPALSPEAFAIAKYVFRHGYMAGGSFVSNAFIKKMADQSPVTQFNNP